jgi:DNA-binding response OmpR family regulator
VVARILVIEDDDVIGINLVRALSAEGWEAERASTGEEALRSLDKASVDLMLLDWG